MRWFRARRDIKSIKPKTTAENQNSLPQNKNTIIQKNNIPNNYSMTSYWNKNKNKNKIKNFNKSKQTKSNNDSKYYSVSTSSSPQQHIHIHQHQNTRHNNIIKEQQYNHIHLHNLNINTNNTVTNINNIPIDDSDSELDDDAFPAAIRQESKSFLSRKSTQRHPWADKQLSWFNHFSIGAYWFGWSFLWMPLLIIIIPSQIDSIINNTYLSGSSGSSMGRVMLFGSIGSLICSPVFGHLSDSSQNITGRRKPFLIVGICITTIGLLIMSISPPYFIYCIGFVVSSCGNFISLAPYSALVPDVVPFDQRGICSGWLGACSMFGYLMGGAVSYHLEKLGFFLTFIFLAMVHAFFGWITIHFVPEIHIKSNMYTNIDYTNTDTDEEDLDLDSITDIEDTHGETTSNIMIDDRDPQYKNRFLNTSSVSSGFFSKLPFCNNDFNWLFISRFFIQMGVIVVQENLQYYLKDTKNDYKIFGILLAVDEVQASAVLFAPLLFGALISSIVGGFLSDLYGERKFLVYFSGSTMATCCILFGLNRLFLFDIIISLFFGFGFGVFSAIDWAMATDVLPNPHSYGRDMGMWNLAFTLPQIIGAPLVGNLLDLFRKWKWINIGWLTIFLFSACSLSVGTMLVKKIAHVK